MGLRVDLGRSRGAGPEHGHPLAVLVDYMEVASRIEKKAAWGPAGGVVQRVNEGSRNIRLQRRGPTHNPAYPSTTTIFRVDFYASGRGIGAKPDLMSGSIQDAASELPKIRIPRTRVNKGKKSEGRSCYAPTQCVTRRILPSGRKRFLPAYPS
jgi:hypothetical protein